VTVLMTIIYFVIMDTVKVWFYKTNLGNSTWSVLGSCVYAINTLLSF
jgi:hypothetical protein